MAQFVANKGDEEIDVDGFVDNMGVRYLGKAKLQPDGSYHCLAVVGGALCKVQARIRFGEDDAARASPKVT